MAHTLPDYTTKYKLATIFGQIDNAELAARLGSILTFDRRGNVIWFDDFERIALMWEEALAGVGAAAAISTEWARSKSTSCKLTAGIGAAGLSKIFKYFQYAILSNFGAEISFTSNDSITYFFIDLSCFTGTVGRLGAVFYYPATTTLKYMDSTGAEITLTTSLSLNATNKVFNTIKLVIDPLNNEYKRIILNDFVFDMSGIALRSWATGTTNGLRVQCTNKSLDAANQSIYVDDFILTQNEP